MLNKDTVRTETLPLMTLVDAGNVAQRGLEKRLSSLKLSVAQQRIQLNVALYLPRLSGLLNRLEDRDLITRTRDRQDRRVVWVELTDEGRKVAEEAIDIVVSMSKELEPVLRGPKATDMVEVVRQVRDQGFKIAGVREDVRKEALRRVWTN